MEYNNFIHEIKNSLNAVYGLNELILNSTDIKEIKEYAELANKSITSLEQIEKDFYDYIKTGKPTIKYSIVDIRKIINNVLNDNKYLSEKYKLNIHTDLKRTRAYTDISKLNSVITNLFINACKYSKEGGDIEVKCYTKKATSIIVIKDYGIGMSEKEILQIGTPFYRSKKIERTGTGLGLSIVKKIVDLLNWEFTIKSVNGKYTKVKIIINHITS